MSVSGDYAQPVNVNGYVCWNCSQVADAKKGVDPSDVKPGETAAQDLNFYAHELHEAELMAGSDYSQEVARAAHLETLQWQGIPYEAGYEAQLYHPDVITEFSEFFNPAAWPK